MKNNYFTIAFVSCFALMGVAQNTVTVDAGAAQIGYANVFETPTNGGAYVFGQDWVREDGTCPVRVENCWCMPCLG